MEKNYVGADYYRRFCPKSEVPSPLINFLPIIASVYSTKQLCIDANVLKISFIDLVQIHTVCSLYNIVRA